jgi:hypothetical protein
LTKWSALYAAPTAQIAHVLDGIQKTLYTQMKTDSLPRFRCSALCAAFLRGKRHSSDQINQSCRKSNPIIGDPLRASVSSAMVPSASFVRISPSPSFGKQQQLPQPHIPPDNTHNDNVVVISSATVTPDYEPLAAEEPIAAIGVEPLQPSLLLPPAPVITNNKLPRSGSGRQLPRSGSASLTRTSSSLNSPENSIVRHSRDGNDGGNRSPSFARRS